MKHSDCKMGRKCVSAHGRKCPCASAHGLILRPWLVFFCPHTQLICKKNVLLFLFYLMRI